MIGCDTGADQAVGRRQPVEHVDLDPGVAQQLFGCVEPGRACTHDRDAQRTVG
jgi:hypothetical protein